MSLLTCKCGCTSWEDANWQSCRLIYEMDQGSPVTTITYGVAETMDGDHEQELACARCGAEPPPDPDDCWVTLDLIQTHRFAYNTATGELDPDYETQEVMFEAYKEEGDELTEQYDVDAGYDLAHKVLFHKDKEKDKEVVQ